MEVAADPRRRAAARAARSDAKIDGEDLIFVKAEFNGQTRVTSYSGIVEGTPSNSNSQGRNGAQTTDMQPNANHVTHEALPFPR